MSETAAPMSVLESSRRSGLLSRIREGNAIVCSRRLGNADFLSRAVDGVPADTSAAARNAALAHLIDNLSAYQLADLVRRSRRLR